VEKGKADGMRGAVGDPGKWKGRGKRGSNFEIVGRRRFKRKSEEEKMEPDKKKVAGQKCLYKRQELHKKKEKAVDKLYVRERLRRAISKIALGPERTSANKISGRLRYG